MRHYGKPYDYGFDFITDSASCVSELVYKAYKSHLDLSSDGTAWSVDDHGDDLC